MFNSIVKGLQSFYIATITIFMIILIILCFFHGSIFESIIYIKNEFKKENMRIEFINQKADPFDLVNDMLNELAGGC